MKITREYILEKGFEQYLKLGYSGVSISVLQKNLNIGRASLYYYFQNKDNLFKAIIDEYFVKNILEMFHNLSKTITIPDLIEKFVEQRSQKEKMLFKITNSLYYSTSANFNSLLIFSYIHFPELKKIFRDIEEQKKTAWETAITNSIEKKELKEDFDKKSLVSLFYKITSETYQVKDNDGSSSNLAKDCQQLYNLIKK